MRDNTEYVATARLRMALRQFERAAERSARQNGLTPQRYLMLLMIKAAPGERLIVNDLAEAMQVKAHSVTGAVTRAQEAGLVHRERCSEDARRMWVTLTAEGERRLAAVVDELADERAQLVKAITGGEDAAAAQREKGRSRTDG